jgi:hypothetical protein
MVKAPRSEREADVEKRVREGEQRGRRRLREAEFSV